MIEKNKPCPLQVDDLIRIGDFILLIEAIDSHDSGGKTLGILNRLGSNSSFKQPASLKQPHTSEWTESLTVRCVRITPETSDVKTFTFVADPPVQFNYKPGQFVTLELEINGESVLRSYSISSPPSRPHTLEITVKRVAAAAATSRRSRTARPETTRFARC
ncbi:MAG: hypothetical protein HC772_14970 [Leptolyngbyaceae cyanobacterium CRU_2_3]|nr:hypothetical protein [Leptolyngbyaceae cyanobacterium CRU_2_3]